MPLRWRAGEGPGTDRPRHRPRDRHRGLTLRSTFAALSHRDFQLLWSGFVVSNLGSQMQMFGLGWYVVQLAVADGTPQLAPLYLGFVATTRAVPSLVVGLLAGTISDLMDRRRLLMLSASASAIVAAVFAVTVIAGYATLPAVLVLNTLAATAFSFEPVTRSAMIPRLVPRTEIASGIGLIMTTTTTGSLIGPLIGGLLIGPLGVGGLLALNAVSFLPVVLAMVFIRPMPVDAVPRVALWRSVAGGIVYVWRDPFLKVLFALSAFSSIAARPYQQLLPAFAHETLHVGAIELSWLFAAAGAGSMGGSIVIGAAGNSRARGRVLAASIVALGLSTVLLAMERTLTPALVTVALVSAASTAQIGLHIAAYQAAAPDDVRGRVTAVSSSLIQSTTALGALWIGVVGSIAGLGLGLALGGAITVIAGIAALRSRALRAWEDEVRALPVGGTTT